MLRRPLTFAYRNLLFGAEADEVWSLYRLRTEPYAGLARARKVELLARLAAFAYAIEADFQLLRVSRAWSVGSYVAGVLATADPRHAHRARLDAYLDGHRALLGECETSRPEVFLAVRLAARRRKSAVTVEAPALRSLSRLLGLRDPRSISRRRLELLLAEEARAFSRVHDYLDCERATTLDVQWLVRRAFSRAVSEPLLDERFAPQALIVEAAADEGGLALRPLEVDVMRLFDAPIDVERRSLRVEADAGESHQTFLTLGALPAETPFPSAQAELLFAPIEAVGFPVDAVFCARYLPNEDAVALARRRIVDADHIYREESHGDHGPSANSAERPQAARELEQYLTSGERPPLLRASISLCVAARSAEQLEERVDQLRREYGSVRLHRPLGEQLRLFVSHLPAQLSPVRDYDDYLLVEQFGAMVPTATHAVGSDTGPYIGHTASGSRQPVLLDLTDAPRSSRPPAVLCAGAPGSGKTVAAQLLAYQAFLRGSRVIDIDPKDDHRIAEVCGLEHVERTVLTPEERYRGMLDPLRIGSAETRGDLAFNFLIDVLPAPVPAAWQTELRIAVDAVAAAGGRACGEVIERLREGNEDARDAARAISVHAGSGLLRLGFASARSEPPAAGSKQLTSITIAHLTVPDPGTPRADFSTEERTGHALLHLLAAYALHLTGADVGRHKTLIFDEAWLLLGTPAGRALLQRINRLGRSQNATPILATQMLGDVADLEALIGAVLAFGVETDDEARRALRLLHLDADDDRLRQELRGYRRGRCLMRDYEGRVAPIQIDVPDAALLAALDTTPRYGDEPAREHSVHSARPAAA
jgi:hypothetical protein